MTSKYVIATNLNNTLIKPVKSNEKRRHHIAKFSENLAGGKYIYGPPNFIYARKKDVKCATTPS